MASTASSELKKAAYLHGISHEFFREPPLIILRLFHERLIYSLVVFLSDLSVYLILPPFFFFSYYLFFHYPFLHLPEFPGEISLSHVYWIWHGYHVWRFKESTKEGRLFLFYFIWSDLTPFIFPLPCLDSIHVLLQSCYYTPLCFCHKKENRLNLPPLLPIWMGLLLLPNGGDFPNCFILFFTPRWERTDLRGEPLWRVREAGTRGGKRYSAQEAALTFS